MLGLCARISTVEPRPDGPYRFTVRMRAEAPMRVTINALGTYNTFDIGDTWERYEILIVNPTAEYVDIYPLADTTLYVEKAQLTYGTGTYDWRPAPEDDVLYEWTCVGRDEVSVSHVRDIVAYVEYYQLKSSLKTPPQSPTTYPPPPEWTNIEPTLNPDDGTTMTLYKCAITQFSDGTYEWSDVSISTSYEAAKVSLNISKTYQSQVEQLIDSWTSKVQSTQIGTNDDGTQVTLSDMFGMVQLTDERLTNTISATFGQTEELNERLTSLQEQTATSIENVFTRAQSYADDTYGGVRQYVENASVWQRFSADGIEQGASTSRFKSKLTNTELGFYDNDRKVAYVSNSKFAIANGRIDDTLVVGLFTFANGEGGLGISFNGDGSDGT